MKSKKEKKVRPEISQKTYDEVMQFGMEQAIKGKMQFPTFEKSVIRLLEVSK